MFKNGLKKVTYLFWPVEPSSLKSMGMEGSRTSVSKWDCEQSFNLFIPLSGGQTNRTSACFHIHRKISPKKKKSLSSNK